MSNPYGGRPAPAQKSRTGLYFGIACGCLLLVAILVAVVGVGIYLFSQDSGDDDRTGGPSTSQPPEDDPSEDPTTDEETDDPLESPSEDPSEDPSSESGRSFTIDVSAPDERTTLETDDGTLTTENGKFVGVDVTITNDGTEDIGLAGANFLFYDDAGNSYEPRYGSFSTSGPLLAPGEEATALLYADVPEDVVMVLISYTDEVGTGGEELTYPVG